MIRWSLVEDGPSQLEQRIPMRELKLRLETQVLPKCPHCKKNIDEVAYSELHGGFFGKRYIYFCPSCQSSLGVSHRKGFWMG
jgi:hypothetical protein